MKILLLGSNGILGGTLKYFLIKKKISLILLKKLKIKNIKDFEYIKNAIAKKKPNIVINCIVQKNSTIKKISKKKFFLINSKFPQFLSKLCDHNKIYFIQISTDGVFSGNKGNFLETDVKNVKDIYSLSKKRGEVKNKYSCTLRTSFIGPEKYTKKSLFSWFLKQKKKVDGYSNYHFTGLSSLEFSKIIYKYFILKKNFYNKIINIGGNKISKLNLLIKISQTFNKKIKINSKSFPKINRTLNNSKFIKKSGYKIKSWKKMLQDLKRFMIENNYKY